MKVKATSGPSQESYPMQSHISGKTLNWKAVYYTKILTE